MKRHDENNDVRILSKYLRVDTHNKVIRSAKDACVGIRLWGRIDYLTHYKGYVFVWDNTAKRRNTSMDDTVEVKTKKEAHKLSDKR